MTPQQIEAMKLALEALKKCRYRSLADEIADPAITALEEALAQPEQIQPSAYSNTHQPERHELQAKGEHPAPCARHCEANAFKIVIRNLKAQLAQRTWVGLTDEEIDALAIDKDGLPNSHLEFARAIEAAHGIKESK